jgi:Cu(I)/Ag(I) efflux system protein CusF
MTIPRTTPPRLQRRRRMTMVFQVKEPALLDKVKVGDKVKFRAEKAGSGYVVTVIEAAK